MQNKGVMAILKFGGKNTPEEKIRNFFPIIFLFDQKPIYKKIFINFYSWEVENPRKSGFKLKIRESDRSFFYGDYQQLLPKKILTKF